jgi:hypothetical protein
MSLILQTLSGLEPGLMPVGLFHALPNDWLTAGFCPQTEATGATGLRSLLTQD